MTLTDARKILNGPDNAATEYFKKASSETAFDPLLSRQPARSGSRHHTRTLGRAGYAVQLLGKDTIDGHVTNGAVNGLFTLIAAEEQARIRTGSPGPDIACSTSIFGNAISNMTLTDARKILNGPDNAATEYFKKASSEQLTDRFRPIVEQATSSVGVTSSYKDLVGRAGYAVQLLGKDTTDIDGHVTNGAVNGLFTLIAAEEQRIRANPVARGTDLLKKVFQ